MYLIFSTYSFRSLDLYCQRDHVYVYLNEKREWWSFFFALLKISNEIISLPSSSHSVAEVRLICVVCICFIICYCIFFFIHSKSYRSPTENHNNNNNNTQSTICWTLRCERRGSIQLAANNQHIQRAVWSGQRIRKLEIGRKCLNLLFLLPFASVLRWIYALCYTHNTHTPHQTTHMSVRWFVCWLFLPLEKRFMLRITSLMNYVMRRRRCLKSFAKQRCVSWFWSVPCCYCFIDNFVSSYEATKEPKEDALFLEFCKYKFCCSMNSI